MGNIITFDNLRQPDNEIIGQTKPVKAVWDKPVKSLDEVAILAREAGAKFREMFQD